MRESDIVFERGRYWVLRDLKAYVVLCNGVTYSISDSAYERDEDGLSCAVARCGYLADNVPADQFFIAADRWRRRSMEVSAE